MLACEPVGGRSRATETELTCFFFLGCRLIAGVDISRGITVYNIL